MSTLFLKNLNLPIDFYAPTNYNIVTKVVLQMKIGERIKRRRQELEWSQRELAAKMNYSHHSTLARIESGQVDVTQSRIEQFADVLGVSIAYLMGWEEDDKKNDLLSDIILTLRMDNELLDVVEKITKLDADKRNVLKSVLDTFLTDK